MSAGNVIAASGAFGRATGEAALHDNKGAILDIVNGLEGRTFSQNLDFAAKPSLGM